MQLFIIFRDKMLKVTLNGIYRDKNGIDWENALYLQSKTKVCCCCCVLLN